MANRDSKGRFIKGHKPSKESLQKISNSLKGRDVWNKNIPWSEEIKRKMSEGHKTHGMMGTKLYQCWCGMKGRVSNDKNYQHLSVREDWQKFEPFMDWALKHDWKDGLTLDRIENSKGYFPSNCRFATKREQSHNRTTTKLDWDKVKEIREMLKQGITQKEIAADFGIGHGCVSKINLNKRWII